MKYRAYLTIITLGSILILFVVLKLNLIKIPKVTFSNQNNNFTYSLFNLNQLFLEENKNKQCLTNQDCLILPEERCCGETKCLSNPKVGNLSQAREIKQLKEKMCQNVKCPSFSKECFDPLDYIPFCQNNTCQLKKEINCPRLCLAQVIKETGSKEYQLVHSELITSKNLENCQCAQRGYNFLEELKNTEDKESVCQKFKDEGLEAKAKKLCQDYLKEK
jgi:hypothetical protein